MSDASSSLLGAAIDRDGAGEVLRTLRKRAYLVVLAGLMGAVLGMFVSLAMTPKYSATAGLYVTSSADANAQSALQGSLASQQRVFSYSELAKSEGVLEDALTRSGLPMSIDSARAELTVTSAPDTVLFYITATDPDPKRAELLAQAVSDALTDYVTLLERPRGGGTPIAQMTVISEAKAGDSPVSPHTFLNTAIGFFGGVVLSIVALVVIHRLDTNVRDEDDLVDIVVSPMLGVIPSSEDLRVGGGIVNFAGGSSQVAEAYRQLRTNLSFANVDISLRRILVTSAESDEGKTTTAINLSAAIAESGKSVVLIDADLRKRSIAGRLPVSGDIGITNHLAGDADLESLLQPSGVDGLDILASGTGVPNPSELLGSQRAKRMLEELNQRYDFVVVDSPPILPVTDAAVVAQDVDGVLLVVRSGATKKPALREAVRQLSVANANLVGVVLNGVDVGPRGAYTYSEYGSGSSDGVLGRA